MKKLLVLGMAMMMLLTAFAGCSSNDGKDQNTNGNPPSNTNSEDTSTGSDLGAISVISREDGSGTRGAFVELMGIVDENDVDMTTSAAEISNSTSVVLQTVAGNKAAIGYISLGSLNDTVKAVEVDGVAASVDAVKDGSYTVARPFNIATKGDVSELAADFIKFIMSSDGQAVIEEEGYIAVAENAESYSASGLSGTISLAGSTSVAPVMDVLADAYKQLNPDVTIEIQQSGSSAGITSTIEGVCDIGMASRELKDSELAEGLTPTVIAMDGIAVIVNNENDVSALTSDQIKDIFLGNITEWSAISK